MKGILAAVDTAIAMSEGGGRRYGKRRFGLAAAEVGKRGKERISGVIPGMRSAMTFWNIWTFLESSVDKIYHQKMTLTSI
jgi:hypothetical protein